MVTTLIGHEFDAPAFGAGGLAPYEHALQAQDGRSTLRLVDATEPRGVGEPVDVAAFLRPADTVDHRLIQLTTGAVIDLGCGPGRMVEAALEHGRRALGVDLSDAAVRLATNRGLPVLRGSVFDPLPSEGDWGAVLLLDGNIGIGGSPEALLGRAARLVRAEASSRIIVEAHPLDRDRRFEAMLFDGAGRCSEAFPWAQLGVRSLTDAGVRSGLTVLSSRRSGGRRFVVFGSC